LQSYEHGELHKAPTLKHSGPQLSQRRFPQSPCAASRSSLRHYVPRRRQYPALENTWSREIIFGGPGISCRERASSGSPVRVWKIVAQGLQAIVKSASRNCHFLVTNQGQKAVLSVVRSSGYPEAAADNRARTCFGGSGARSWVEDASIPNSRHPRQ